MISRWEAIVSVSDAAIWLVLQYGVSVSESAPEIRAAFVRKVYTILCKNCFFSLVYHRILTYPQSARLWAIAYDCHGIISSLVWSWLLVSLVALCLKAPLLSFGCRHSKWFTSASPSISILPCSSWTLLVAVEGSLVNLGLLYWKRHSHPLNLIFLSSFTLLESLTIGVVIAFYDTTIVLQALYVLVLCFILLITNTLDSGWSL